MLSYAEILAADIFSNQFFQLSVDFDKFLRAPYP